MRKEEKALDFICAGSIGERIDGKFIQRLADCGEVARSKEMTRYLDLLQTRTTTSTNDLDDMLAKRAQETHKHDIKAIESRGAAQKAIEEFARSVGEACTIQKSTTIRTEPPVWVLHVIEFKKGKELAQKYSSLAKPEKDYYAIQCTKKETGAGEPTRYVVYRRWSSLKRFFELKELKGIASKTQIQEILSCPPKPPPDRGRNCTAEARLQPLQGYFDEWNAWNAALWREDSFAVTEVQCVWEYLTMDKIWE